MRPCNVRPGKMIFLVEAVVLSSGCISAHVEKGTILSIEDGRMKIVDENGQKWFKYLESFNIPRNNYNLYRAFFHPKAAHRYCERMRDVKLRGAECDIHAEIAMERSFDEAQEDYEQNRDWDESYDNAA
jgi:hypothetical protein